MRHTLTILALFMLPGLATAQERVGLVFENKDDLSRFVAAQQLETTEQELGPLTVVMVEREGQKLMLTHAGPGLANAAAATALLADEADLQALVYVARLGALAKEQQLGQVFLATEVQYHDYGRAVDGGALAWPMTQLGGGAELGENLALMTEKEASKVAKAAAKLDQPVQVHLGRLVSGQQQVASALRREVLTSHHEAQAADQGAAAAAQVAASFEVPCRVVGLLAYTVEQPGQRVIDPSGLVVVLELLLAD